MQLTRWNPFVELDDIQNRLNRLFVDKAVKTPSDAFADFIRRSTSRKPTTNSSSRRICLT